MGMLTVGIASQRRFRPQVIADLRRAAIFHPIQVYHKRPHEWLVEGDEPSQEICECPLGGGRFQITSQVLGTDRILHFGNRFRLDLSHALSRYLENPPNFFQGVRVTVHQTVP